MRQKIVAGNWKMNGNRAMISDYVQVLLGTITALNNGVQVVVAPPMPLLTTMEQMISAQSSGGRSRLALAAQNVAASEKGAFTGESSAAMLKEAGCQYSLVGHSERRALFGETNGQVLEKVKQLHAVGLTPILCVGETLEERESGRAEAIVTEQVMAVIAELDDAKRMSLVMAYEPVWAIGTGKTASPEQAQAMHAAIRESLAGLSDELAEGMTILYGGSVNAANAQALFAQKDIDGGLVGGASLKADEFSQICEAMG